MLCLASQALCLLALGFGAGRCQLDAGLLVGLVQRRLVKRTPPVQRIIEALGQRSHRVCEPRVAVPVGAGQLTEDTLKQLLGSAVGAAADRLVLQRRRYVFG